MRPRSSLPYADLSWIGVDWGTTNMRAWGLNSTGRVLCENATGDGMANLRSGDFESALLSVVGEWLPEGRTTPVLACGMVGAKQGWIEAPYVTVPCHPSTSLIEAPTQDDRLKVHLLAGICQTDPADVMRGEETQISGVLSQSEDCDGIICLPGTHSKWVLLRNGHVVEFQTFMTGELYAACKDATVLRHSMNPDGFSIDAFETAVKLGLEQPQHAADLLFRVRADSLLGKTSPVDGSSRVSGTLISMELASIRARWAPKDVVVIGNSELNRRYKRALTIANIRCRCLNSTDMAVEGLKKAWKANFVS